MVFGYLAGRFSERWSINGTLILGLIMCVLGATGLLVTAVGHLPLAAVMVSMLIMVSGTAVTTPPTTSLALADYPEIAGTAAALLGVARYALAYTTLIRKPRAQRPPSKSARWIGRSSPSRTWKR